MFRKFREWRGSRKEFLNVLTEIEEKNKSKYMMISNKTGKRVPVNTRRVQQYLDNGILPRAKMIKGEYLYNYDHIVRYLAAISLKNEGHSMIQIDKILSSHELEEITDIYLDVTHSKNFNSISNKQNLKMRYSNAENSEKLKKLGREEGRVLRSQWLKFAITKWCHLDIRKKELIKLNEKQIETLSEVISNTLLSFKAKDVDKLIK